VSYPAKVIHWNGHDVPPELAVLPPGAYAVAPVVSAAEVWGLTPEEVTGLEDAAEALDGGEGIPLEAVDAEMRAMLTAAQKAHP
jgi:hypothetical protein